MSGQFEGKVTLIVGGTSGIGHAAALAFAREGGRVVVSGRNITAGEKIEGQIKDMGEGAFIRADIAKASDIENLVLMTIERYGRLDCAVNNAATTGGEGLIHESSEESWDLVMDTNLKGLWLCMRYEIAQMLRQGHGSIVNTTSIGGLVGFARNPIYAASKHGVVGLTRSAALQYAETGIRINAVAPGPVRTPMIEHQLGDSKTREYLLSKVPMRRIGDPIEVARAMLWLCSDAASYVTGHTLAVDGGYLA